MVLPVVMIFVVMPLMLVAFVTFMFVIMAFVIVPLMFVTFVIMIFMAFVTFMFVIMPLMFMPFFGLVEAFGRTLLHSLFSSFSFASKACPDGQREKYAEKNKKGSILLHHNDTPFVVVDLCRMMRFIIDSLINASH